MKLADVTELLPAIVSEFIDVIGLENTQKLIDKYGGTTFPISSKRHNKQHEPRYNMLLELLGEEAMGQLVARFGGDMIYIPNCTAALRIYRNRCFLSELNRLINEQNCSISQAIALLCPRFKISDRLGWSIINERQQKDAQLDLL